MTRFALRSSALVATLLLSSAAVAADTHSAAGRAVGTPAVAGSLYARLGGETAVTRISSATIDRAVQDPRTGRSFKGSNLTRVKKHLAQQICELAGGGCTYEGDPMREVHAGHDISESEFYALVEILQDVLRAEGVGTAERNALLAKLAPMKRDVVRVEPPGPEPAAAGG